ncbi:MAG: DUF4157 domain-containing protein [Steroidobacteraceae bacterium]|nr:DUF4157 domain-containing protein [Steroidobacteraceae bacterium]
MIHESAAQRKPAGFERRPASHPVSKKSGERESSGANAVRQRAGNEGIQRMMSEMSGARIQAKLTVSQPGDAHEQQADRVANAVMAAPSPGMQEMPTASTHAVQRRCADCDEEMGKKPGAQVQRMEQGAGAAPPVTPAVAANLHAMRGGGSVLPADTRAFFEPRFNADFSQVRVHKGTQAEEAAQSIGAKAFTMGRDIGFAKGQYAPESREGRTLLAHELTHVVQQGGAAGTEAPIQRKVDEESFARRGGKIEEVGDTTGGGFGEGVAESNEFLLWNYNVSSSALRTEHTKYLKEKVLTATRWPTILSADPDLKVAIVGGASSTGGAAITTPLSVARADNLKAALVSGGIDGKRIVTSGVGSRHPFADETSSENMAKNRRVEAFLFRPTKRVASQPGVSVTVTNLSAAVAAGFDRDISNPNLLSLRWKPFIFSADVQATGPANMTVGILQFLRSDSRVGVYRSTGAGNNFVLDFGRCMQPDLPCKDVAESMGRFSGPGRLEGPGTGKVSMGDRPGNAVTIQVNDPKSGTLVKAHWEMEFVAVIGAQVGSNFLPVKSVVWRLEDDHARDSSGALNPTKVEAKAEAPENGAPADLAIENAMAGRTCRFMARRQSNFCKPELT